MSQLKHKQEGKSLNSSAYQVSCIADVREESESEGLKPGLF